MSARNQADNLIHASRKTMKELGDKVQSGEKDSLERAIKELEEAIKSDDKDRIERKTQALSEVSGKMAERLYAQPGAGGGGHGPGDAGAQGRSKSGGGARDDVVDAEFEEVRDDKK